MSNSTDVAKQGSQEPSGETTPATSDAVLMTEFGATGLRHSGGWIQDEFLCKLRGRRGVDIYTEMRWNNAVIGAMMLLAESLIVQAAWRIKPAGARPDAEQQFWAKFVREELDQLPATWEEHLRDAWSMAWFGWSYFEVTYRQRPDGRIGWREFGIRRQNTLERWEINEQNDKVRGMHQQTRSGRRAFIPLWKAIHYRTTPAGGNPEGVSLLRNAYRSWFFLKHLQEIEGIGIERDLAGLPVAYVPAEYLAEKAPPEFKKMGKKIKDIVVNIRRDAREGIVFPAKTKDGKATGFDLELLKTGGRRTGEVSAAIVRYETRIAMTLLSQFLLLGQQTNIGSFALADSSTNTHAISLGAIMNTIASDFTRQAIHRLMLINGVPEKNWPRMIHGDIEKQAISELSSFVTNMLNAGLLTPDEDLEEFLREQGGLPAPLPTEASDEDGEST